jgi:uncharacterized protein (TIGR04255 family)
MSTADWPGPAGGKHVRIRIPRRLGKEPLVEAIWQAVLDPPAAVPLGDLLPGMLYAEFRKTDPALRLVRLPVADVPRVVADVDPSLRHAVKFRLESPASPFILQIGDRVATMNCRWPYSGWRAFKEHILTLVDLLASSGLIPSAQRHSLRYIDLLRLESPPSIRALQMPLVLGQLSLDCTPLQLRVEVNDGVFLHNLQVVTPAEVQILGETCRGTLVDLETRSPRADVGWNEVGEDLDRLHDASKRLFFESILRPEAIDAMEPDYADHEC